MKNSAALLKPVTVALDLADRDRLDVIARRLTVSRSWTVRRAIAVVLKHPELLLKVDGK